MKALHRKLSRYDKRSDEYLRILSAVKKTYYKVKCQRSDFIHKAVNDLLKSSDLIIHEDLDIVSLLRRPSPIQGDHENLYLPNGAAKKSKLNKSISDAGWGKFISVLNYKANEQGKCVVAVNPYMTSQKCSKCGEIVKKSLSTRTHFCHHCGYSENRDKNAANNILSLGLERLGIPLEAHANN